MLKQTALFLELFYFYMITMLDILPKWYNFAFKIAKDKSIADDIMQDVAYKILKYKPVYLNEPQSVTYIKTAILNKSKDYSKWRSRLKETSLWEQSIEDVICVNDIEDILEAKENMLQALCDLKVLSEIQKTVLVAKISGYSIKDIAMILEIKPNAVLSHIFKAKCKLSKLNKYGFQQKRTG